MYMYMYANYFFLSLFVTFLSGQRKMNEKIFLNTFRSGKNETRFFCCFFLVNIDISNSVFNTGISN